MGVGSANEQDDGGYLQARVAGLSARRYVGGERCTMWNTKSW